ncbi:hypothetical protein QQ045_021206 [Rhodiola kirilowii]
MWSSRQKMGYMSITAHWIDDKWNMQKRILSFKMVEYPHTGDSLASHMYEELIDWHLHDKVFTLTLDNASSNDVLVTRLASHLMLTSVSNQLLHVRCTCHILNLIVQDGLSVLSPSIEKITAIVRSMNSSIKRHELWVSSCAELGLIATVRSVLNQLYDMYKRNLLVVTCPLNAETARMPSSVALEPKIDVNIPVVPSASMAKLKRARVSSSGASTDLQIYLDLDTLDVDDNGTFNILDWWKANSSMYPILSIMARDLLSIPALTVASEAAFGRVVSEKRASLSPNTIEALICLKD